MCINSQLTKPVTIIILACLAVFLLSLAVHYYPIYKKGYPADVKATNLILARNLAKTGEYKIENQQNVILSSDLIKEKGVQSSDGNKLTSVIYGWVFRIFGFQPNLPIYISLFLSSLTAVLLLLLICRLFNLKIALIFSAIYAFLPIVVQEAVTPGFYEFGIFFFLLAVLFFLYKEKSTWYLLLFSGLLFGLAGLCRNAFLISFIPFVIYYFYREKSLKRVLIFVIPFILIIAAFWLPAYLQGSFNTYLFSDETSSFSRYGHLFPDPYTYYFEKDSFTESVIGSSNVNTSEFLTKYGYSVSFKNKILMYFGSLKFYILDAFRFIRLGGSLIIIFLLAGGLYLYRKKNSLLKLFIIWGIVWYLLLIVFKTNNWDHFLEVLFPIILMISLGIYWFLKFASNLVKGKSKYILVLGLFFLILLHLVQANKWMLYDVYRSGNIDLALESAQAVKNYELSNTDVVAVDIHPKISYLLNYYTDCNFIYFHQSTVERLLEGGRLQWAFDQFGVTKVIGFNEELTKEIIQNTDVDSIKI